MPTPTTKAVGSLFAGIGGFDLAARWCGWTTRWYSEIEPYACKIMARHFPEAENLGDITKLTNPPPVDVLVGGFPCQDISVANAKGEGLNGKRSGLWAEYARLINEVRPSWVVIENSPNLRRKGLDRVLRDLVALGYDAEWHCIPASAVSAPHQRDRIWIIAYPAGSGLHVGHAESERVGVLQSRGSAQGSSEAASSGAVDADHPGRRDRGSEAGNVAYPMRDGSAAGLPRPEPREEGHARVPLYESLAERLRWAVDGWWATEPNVGRVAHGVPARVDRIRCLGNAVVPAIPYLIFRAIEAYEADHVLHVP